MTLTPAKAMEAQFEMAEKILRDYRIRILFQSRASGIMDVPQRWALLRRAVIRCKLADKYFKTLKSGADETYAQALERLTGEPLTAPVAA